MDSARRAPAGLGALIAMALLTAPSAGAEPIDPAGPSSPAAVEAPPSPASVEAAPAAVPHLPSPENLPPGTTQTAPEQRTLGYLRDIWNTVRTDDVTMSELSRMLLVSNGNATTVVDRLEQGDAALAAVLGRERDLGHE